MLKLFKAKHTYFQMNSAKAPTAAAAAALPITRRGKDLNQIYSPQPCAEEVSHIHFFDIHGIDVGKDSVKSQVPNSPMHILFDVDSSLVARSSRLLLVAAVVTFLLLPSPSFPSCRPPFLLSSFSLFSVKTQQRAITFLLHTSRRASVKSH